MCINLSFEIITLECSIHTYIHTFIHTYIWYKLVTSSMLHTCDTHETQVLMCNFVYMHVLLWKPFQMLITFYIVLPFGCIYVCNKKITETEVSNLISSLHIGLCLLTLTPASCSSPCNFTAEVLSPCSNALSIILRCTSFPGLGISCHVVCT